MGYQAYLRLSFQVLSMTVVFVYDKHADPKRSSCGEIKSGLAPSGALTHFDEKA